MHAYLLPIVIVTGFIFAQDKAASEAHGRFTYSDFEAPTACRPCHVDLYHQWEQAMMSQAYTHHWDEIEYFRLAVPHADKEPKVAEVKDGCNGCHAPTAFLAGDTPPPHPSKGSRANESVSCDVCHTIKTVAGETPFNFNFVSTPGKVKYGAKGRNVSPYHTVVQNDFTGTPELCGSCHNEQSPYGVWVKSTYLEWAEGPYPKQGVTCMTCHMPKAYGINAIMAKEKSMVAQHLFHGAHDDGKLRSVVELRLNPDTRELEPSETVTLSMQLFNAKTGHKFPSGSAEERVLWVHVEAVDEDGNVYHIPVDPKGFKGEEYTIASEALAYQDLGIPLGIPDFPGIRREMIPVGDRIFRLPYLNPDGKMTIMQWYTASFGPDYRIGPRETKIETYTWQIPDDIAEGRVEIRAEMYYRKLPVPVAEFLDVPEEESRAVLINDAHTWIEIFY
ncbi:MAG: NapC/NirT family cytochrome c [Fidelibacterota bacterium]|nr:MAG: NapC/NirT family cytochrome c [Candidatus Neomarinimicrobiota bacterium]